MTTVIIESASSEPVDVDITADDDPTGSNPEFLVTAKTATSPSGTWVAGFWRSTWSSTGRLTARTPTIGATGAGLEVTEGSYYKLWVRWGTVIKVAADIQVN